MSFPPLPVSPNLLAATESHSTAPSADSAPEGQSARARRSASAPGDALGRVRALVQRERAARLLRERDAPTPPAQEPERQQPTRRSGRGHRSAATPLRFWFETGADIVARRNNLNLSQPEFWAKVFVCQSTASRYERQGRSIPVSVKVLLQIAYGTETQREEAIRAVTQGN